MIAPAGRAALAGTVTVAVWSLRVAARVLAILATLMAETADLADRARGRTAVPAADDPAPTTDPQLRLTS